MISWAVVGGWLRGALRVLGTGVTIPLGVIIAAAIWWQIDKGSAIRTAVDRAVTELVAGEELAAAKAETDGLRAILEEQKRRAALADIARKQFETQMAEAERQAGELADELADIQSRPVNDACLVDGGILDRLPNR